MKNHSKLSIPLYSSLRMAGLITRKQLHRHEGNANRYELVVPIQCSLKLVERVKTQKYVQTWQPVLIFQRRSPTPRCGANPGGYDRHILTRPRFLYSALPTPKFHHSMFTRSEVIVLTNKQTNTPAHPQTDAAENIQCSSLCYNVGQNIRNVALWNIFTTPCRARKRTTIRINHRSIHHLLCLRWNCRNSVVTFTAFRTMMRVFSAGIFGSSTHTEFSIH